VTFQLYWNQRQQLKSFHTAHLSKHRDFVLQIGRVHIRQASKAISTSQPQNNVNIMAMTYDNVISLQVSLHYVITMTCYESITADAGCFSTPVITAVVLVFRAFQFGPKKFRFDSIRQSDKFAACTQIVSWE